MCSGAIVLYKIPRVVVGENRNFQGGEDYLRLERHSGPRGRRRPGMHSSMADFIRDRPELWNGSRHRGLFLIVVHALPACRVETHLGAFFFSLRLLYIASTNISVVDDPWSRRIARIVIERRLRGLHLLQRHALLDQILRRDRE